ncbi:MAG: serine/threonine protein kinase [Planctomycetota bacterium]|nr:MAG: serine/threonine protein kinase [Planctomycetota bacterium]
MEFAHFRFDPETDRLGEGPLSEVYRAVDSKLGRTVALKILRAHAEIDPQADKRFEREAKHTSNIKHPNIATIYEYDQFEGTSYIAMEFLQGRTLDKIIKDKTLGFGECVRIAIQLTDALMHVHKQHLIHRDLKPGNIILQDDGSVKLLDFGIARARDEAGITQHGMLVGTVLYMSPEQVRGEHLDYRSDVFSLGAVLYEVTTGVRPFPGDSFPEVCMAILEGCPRAPSLVRSGFPKPYEDFLVRCMRPDPMERFQDAEEAHSALLAMQEKISGTDMHATTKLRGHLLLSPLLCQGSAIEACSVMAGGLLKDLAGELSRNKDLKVTFLENGNLPPDGNFDYVLRGSLEVTGHRGTLELDLETYDGSSGILGKVYKDAFEEEDEDEWSLQADLVRNALRTVRKRLTQASVQPVAQRSPRMIEEAEALAVGAREMLLRGTTKHLLAAMSSFRRALDLDRFCALAYAGLAEAMVRKFLYWDGDPTFIEEARDDARRALALDSSCALAHTAIGFANHLTGHHVDAEREYRLAMQLDNEEWTAHRLLGAILEREGNFKHAAPLLRRAVALRPEHIASYDHWFTVLQRLDRYEEALEVADRGITAANKHLAAHPDDQDARLHMAMLQARIGQHDTAREQADEACRRSPKDAFTAFHACCVYSLVGEPTEALELLKHAQSRGYYIKSELARNTDLDLLRGLPEFEELLQR